LANAAKPWSSESGWGHDGEAKSASLLLPLLLLLLLHLSLVVLLLPRSLLLFGRTAEPRDSAHSQTRANEDPTHRPHRGGGGEVAERHGCSRRYILAVAHNAQLVSRGG